MPKRRYSMWQDKACYVLYRPFPQKYGRNTPDSKTGKFPVSVPAFSLSAHYKNVFAVVLVIKLRPTVVERQGLSDRQSVAAHGSGLL